MRQGYIRTFAICLAVFLAVACGKEEGPTPQSPTDVPQAEYEELIVNAAVATKTVLNVDEKRVDWCQGDAISVFSTNITGGDNNKLDSDLTTPTDHEATFRGKIESGTTGVVALYPYTAAAAYSGGTVTGMSIPTEQTATGSSFANGASVTIAKGSTQGDKKKTAVLIFENLCAVLTFTLPEGISADWIKVQSKDGLNMSGAVTIDSAAKAITSASASYVMLSGTFEGGREYCVTVAPGTYPSGFTFTIHGTGNSTFEREVAVEVEAEKGIIYKMGSLSYVADGSAVSASAAISHTYSSNVLTGSDATLTLTVNNDAVPAEFRETITKWTLKNVKFSQGGTDFRAIGDGESIDVTSGVATQPIPVVNSKPYMPHTVGSGAYSWTADVYYTVKSPDSPTGTGTVEKFLKTLSGTATSPAPDAGRFTLDANVSGYTSYNYGTGTDKTKNVNYANNLSATRIYEIDVTYKSGLSAEVAAQCQSLFSASPTIDGSAFSYDTADGKGSGNQKGGQTWAAHTLGALASFDGSTQQTCATTRTVYITGLPYKAEPPKNSGSNPWNKQEGNVKWETNYVNFLPGVDWITGYCRIGSPTFHLPSNINVNAQCYVTCSSGAKHPMSLRLGGVGDQTLEEVDMGGLYGYKEYSFNKDAEMIPGSRYCFLLEYKYGTAGPDVKIYNFYVNYR